MIFFPLDLRNGGLKETVMQSRTGHTCWVGVASEWWYPCGWKGWLAAPMKDVGRRKTEGREGEPRVSVRAEGSRLDCLLLMATQMAFMALIYRALIVVESG